MAVMLILLPFGSSPLARGTPWRFRPVGGLWRLIPARAGNTYRTVRGCCGCTAHPRSRGEHELTTMTTNKQTGSSPLARGTPHTRINARSHTRLIPARAGNTYVNIMPELLTPAHPRSRGEHEPRGSKSEKFTGSSPLARGTQPRLLRYRSPGRLIPARAGNTLL